MIDGHRQRVVITGMGAITPFGTGVAPFWTALVEGKSAVTRVTRVDLSDFPCRIGAEIVDFDPAAFFDRKEARRMDRFTQFAVAAARLAVQDAGLNLDHIDRDRLGVILGTGFGGMETLSEQFSILLAKGPGRVSPFLVPMMIANMGAAQIAIDLGARGPNETVVTACASSNNAMGEAFRLLERGDADVVITGGVESCITHLAYAGFTAMKALSCRNEDPARASRPFDAGRDGFVMGEGAGVLVFERLEHARARGARIYAEVIGYGMTSDAYHMTQPPADGSGGARAMLAALADAGLRPEDVDYINAHATSTPLGDAGEVQAIKTVFGEHAYTLAVSATKSMTGHLLGAAGGVEMIATVKALEEGILPPTINQEEPDPACDLDCVPNKARRRDVQVALSNSFGFGGQNATLIVKRCEG